MTVTKGSVSGCRLHTRLPTLTNQKIGRLETLTSQKIGRLGTLTSHKIDGFKAFKMFCWRCFFEDDSISEIEVHLYMNL